MLFFNLSFKSFHFWLRQNFSCMVCCVLYCLSNPYYSFLSISYQKLFKTVCRKAWIQSGQQACLRVGIQPVVAHYLQQENLRHEQRIIVRKFSCFLSGVEFRKSWRQLQSFGSCSHYEFGEFRDYDVTWLLFQFWNLSALSRHRRWILYPVQPSGPWLWPIRFLMTHSVFPSQSVWKFISFLTTGLEITTKVKIFPRNGLLAWALGYQRVQ